MLFLRRGVFQTYLVAVWKGDLLQVAVLGAVEGLHDLHGNRLADGGDKIGAGLAPTSGEPTNAAGYSQISRSPRSRRHFSHPYRRRYAD